MRFNHLFFLLVVCSISSYSQQWVQKNNFSGSPRYVATGFSNGGYGYICAGRDNSSSFLDLWQYDISTDIWSSKSDFPGQSRSNLISFTIDTLSYVGLGYDHLNNINFYDIYRYNPSSDNWTLISTFPGAGSRGSAATSLNGKGYVLGGGTIRGSAFVSKEIWEYYPVSDSWVQRPDLPAPARTGGIAFAIDSMIYYGLGHNHSIEFNDLWAFDPATNSWTQKAFLPGSTRYNASIMVVNGKIVVGGGQRINGTVLTDYYLYDPNLDSWTSLPSMSSQKRANSSYFSIDRRGFIVTGRDIVSNPLNDVWEYTDSTLITNISSVEGDFEDKLKAFPNPSNGLIYFNDIDDSVERVEVFSTSGKLVKSIKPPQLSGKYYSADLSNLSNGIYFYRIVSSENTYSGKVVLE